MALLIGPALQLWQYQHVAGTIGTCCFLGAEAGPLLPLDPGLEAECLEVEGIGIKAWARPQREGL